MHIPSIIEKKRDGARLSLEEINASIAGLITGEIPDYQISALAMAIYFRGMDAGETAVLTRAMLHSGDVFSYPRDHPTIVDKHSTGGIGDKVSLVLAPLLACDDNLWMPMISGRGLGITGGTLDKLESIPGFNVNLTQSEAITQLQKISVVIMGQTENICPADKKLYALRDVTGTVPSIPLIVASIMCKKLAESLDTLVLDVKFGSGAFMQTRAEAETLAEAMREVGEQMNVDTRYLLTPMDEPLGRTVGNALEVSEAIDTLHGSGPDDLRELTLDLAAQVARASREQLAAWLDDGTAWEKFVALVETQGGDSTCLDHFHELHPAPVVREVPAEHSGTLKKVIAGDIGRIALSLGAGRQTTTDTVDFAVGLDAIAKTGAPVEKGDILARILARTEDDAEHASAGFCQAIMIA